MADSYSKQAQNQYLSVTLRELGIDESATYITSNKTYNSLFLRLTMYTPTTQSHLGLKFDSYKGLNDRTSRDLVKQIFSGLGVKSIYLYNSYDSDVATKTNILTRVLADTESMICLKCIQGIRNSLYMAVRNAIAHGNIIRCNGYYILYSVADDKKEYDSAITFILRVKSLKRLEAFTKTLDLYK